MFMASQTLFIWYGEGHGKPVTIKRSKWSFPIACAMLTLDLTELIYYYWKQKKMTFAHHMEFRDGIFMGYYTHGIAGWVHLSFIMFSSLEGDWDAYYIPDGTTSTSTTTATRA